MKRVLSLFIMLDACGWEIIKNRPFLKNLAPNRKCLDSVFGYSSTCVPSILSGRWPDEHRNWCYFVYDPKNSPFAFLKPFRWLPKLFTSRRIFRNFLTKLVKKRLGFQGYFDLYNIPFKDIALYDFTEKKSPLKPGGMNRGPNVFDFVEQRKIPYFVSNPDVTEDENREALLGELRKGKIDFAFMYWPGLDGLLHRVGNTSHEIPAKLDGYEKWIADVFAEAGKSYEEVRLYVFSDHGMANCDEHVDLKSKIESLPLKHGKDYAVIYDSTMARFWFFNERARSEITQALQKVPQGRVMPDGELKQLRTYFEDRQFGDLFFLMKEGVLIVPSHMGERPIRAMHGYHPNDKHSYAAMMSNQTLEEELTAIPHIGTLMMKEAVLAFETNNKKEENEPAGEAVLSI